MAGLAQILGCALVVAAIAMLAGLWWAVGVAGLLLTAAGVLAEAAGSSPAVPPADPGSVSPTADGMR